ncbi:hypothetical protein ACSC95_06030 [Burkholderia vietnamiensis]|uniref:hypothetical protein n=1 Tax=Burkholderia cepacia complex TaxID=87882 RepID=UPI001B9E036F|nr:MULTISPECIES: hypothetical protein [Burkholderia cepacia complex]MBR8279765.1 hypothetical protein [Burkholderia vietnamiensis]MBU9563802.1 hypothetical protein [Burkholderia multivorans]
MKLIVGMTVLLCSLGAHAAATIPDDCKAPRMDAMERAAIPQLLDLEPGTAQIRAIHTIGGSGAYEYQPGLWRIDCWIDVTWSNGTVDRDFKFSAWTDRYGGYKGAYGPPR